MPTVAVIDKLSIRCGNLKDQERFHHVFCLSYFVQGAKDKDVMFLAFYICLYLNSLASIPLLLFIKFHTDFTPSVLIQLYLLCLHLIFPLHLFYTSHCLYQTFFPCMSRWSSCSGSEGTVVRFSWSPVVLATVAVPGYMSNQLLLKNSDFASASQAGAC